MVSSNLQTKKIDEILLKSLERKDSKTKKEDEQPGSSTLSSVTLYEKLVSLLNDNETVLQALRRYGPSKNKSGKRSAGKDGSGIVTGLFSSLGTR